MNEYVILNMTTAGSVHSVAESLLLFLECLAEPVIPFSVYYQCLSAANNLLLSKQVGLSVCASGSDILCLFLFLHLSLSPTTCCSIN